MAFDLSSLQSSKSGKPPRIVLYGDHGIGKSTFGASAPSPVFMPSEDGLDYIDVKAFPVAKSYEDLCGHIEALLVQDHDFQTVVLDTADWAEKLVHDYTARSHGEDSIESFGFGKGYVHAANVFRELLDGFNALRLKKNMTVIITAHCEVKRFDDPTAESYDRFQLKLHKSAAALLAEWCDVLAFAQVEAFVQKEEQGFGKKKGRAVATGQRVMHCNRKPAFDAKNRAGLPDTLPLSWSAFEAAIAATSN